jgi:hypothetical protein
MKKEKWKILFLVDNDTAYHGTKCNGKILSLNLTTEVQPIDLGVIQAVKACKMMLQYLVTITEASNMKSDFKKSINTTTYNSIDSWCGMKVCKTPL